MSEYGQDKRNFVRKQIVNLSTNTVWSNKLETCRKNRTCNSPASFRNIYIAKLCSIVACTILKVSLSSQILTYFGCHGKTCYFSKLTPGFVRFAQLFVYVAGRFVHTCQNAKRFTMRYTYVCFNNIQHKIWRGSWGVICPLLNTQALTVMIGIRFHP